MSKLAKTGKQILKSWRKVSASSVQCNKWVKQGCYLWKSKMFLSLNSMFLTEQESCSVTWKCPKTASQQQSKKCELTSHCTFPLVSFLTISFHHFLCSQQKNFKHITEQCWVLFTLNPFSFCFAFLISRGNQNLTYIIMMWLFQGATH